MEQIIIFFYHYFPYTTHHYGANYYLFLPLFSLYNTPLWSKLLSFFTIIFLIQHTTMEQIFIFFYHYFPYTTHHYGANLYLVLPLFSLYNTPLWSKSLSCFTIIFLIQHTTMEQIFILFYHYFPYTTHHYGPC